MCYSTIKPRWRKNRSKFSYQISQCFDGFKEVITIPIQSKKDGGIYSCSGKKLNKALRRTKYANIYVGGKY